MSKVIGDIAEAYVIYRLFTYGYNAQLFFSDNVPYDAIVDVGSSLIRIQIKGSSTFDPKRKSSCRFSIAKGAQHNDYYTKEDFDVLALVYTAAERCLFYPNTGFFTKCKRISRSRFTEDNERGTWYESIKAFNT